MSTRPVLPAPPISTGKLASEQVILASPMSYSGFFQRMKGKAAPIANAVPSPRPELHPAARIAIMIGGLVWKAVVYLTAATLAILAVAVITVWYVLSYTLFFIPTVIWRFFRRGQRKDKRQALQHREMMETIESTRR